MHFRMGLAYFSIVHALFWAIFFQLLVPVLLLLFLQVTIT